MQCAGAVVEARRSVWEERNIGEADLYCRPRAASLTARRSPPDVLDWEALPAWFVRILSNVLEPVVQGSGWSGRMNQLIQIEGYVQFRRCGQNAQVTI